MGRLVVCPDSPESRARIAASDKRYVNGEIPSQAPLGGLGLSDPKPNDRGSGRLPALFVETEQDQAGEKIADQQMSKVQQEQDPAL